MLQTNCMSLFSLKKRAKSTDLATIKEPKIVICENCGSHIHSKFCSECGQKAISYNKPMREAVSLLLDSWLSFDNRVVHTIGPLFVKPGYLSREFIVGRRAKYMSPLKLFLFSSVMFFTLGHFSSYDGMLSIDDDKPVKTEEATKKDSLMAAKMVAYLNLDNEVTEHKTLKDSINRLVAGRLSEADSLRNLNVDSALNVSKISQKSGKLNIELSDDTTSVWHHIEKRVNRFQNNKGELNHRVSKASSYMFFVLMPIFAFLLMLLFLRKRKYYIEHLVLSIHIHAFGFLFLGMLFLFELVSGRETPYMATIIFLGFSIYVYKSFRNYYGGGRFSCLSKTMALWILYSVVFLIVFVVSVLIAMLL